MVRNLVVLTCQEVVELVTEYLSEAMLAEDRSRLEQHLHTCPACVAYVHQVKQTIALTGRLDEDALPEDKEHELLGLFRNWKKG